MDAVTTLFYGLYVGVVDSEEEEAQIIAVFSSEERAGEFQELLEAKAEEEGEDVPSLFWDIRPIAFDPRTEE